MGGQDRKDFEERELEKATSSQTLSTSSDDIHSIHTPSQREPSPRTSTTVEQDDPNRAASVTSDFGVCEPVPKGQRRGWLARFAIIAEAEEPKSYPRRTKWIITFIVAVAAAAAPMGSSIVLRMICPIFALPLHVLCDQLLTKCNSLSR